MSLWLAVVGVGRMGALHAATLSATPAFEVVAVKKLAAEAAAAGRILQVGFWRRFSPPGGGPRTYWTKERSAGPCCCALPNGMPIPPTGLL